MHRHPRNPLWHQDHQWLQICRRELLKRSGFGLGAVALHHLLGTDGLRAATTGAATAG